MANLDGDSWALDLLAMKRSEGRACEEEGDVAGAARCYGEALAHALALINRRPVLIVYQNMQENERKTKNIH